METAAKHMAPGYNEDEIEEELIPTRKSLLSRLRNLDDQEGWRDFFATYWKLIYNAAIKAGLTDAEAQDVVQETVIAVSRSLPGFRYDPQVGSFKGWLKRLTGWRIADQLRLREPAVAMGRPRRVDSPRTDTVGRIPDPAGSIFEAMWDAEWEKNLVDAAMGRVKRMVDARQYQLFDLYVVKQWPVAKVTTTLGVSRMRVYLAKHRVSALVRKEIKCLERQSI